MTGAMARATLATTGFLSRRESAHDHHAATRAMDP